MRMNQELQMKLFVATQKLTPILTKLQEEHSNLEENVTFVLKTISDLLEGKNR